MFDNTGCLSSLIKVAAGHYFDIANPNPELVDMYSIAAALSKTCRYGGHIPKFYSVAEHSILAMELAEADGLENSTLRAILLHDAAEAYIGDMVRPLKQVMHDFQEVERVVESAISARFDVHFSENKAAIKKYDNIMLKAEKFALWPEDIVEWAGLRDVENRLVKWGWWGPKEAEREFLKAAERLWNNVEQ